MSRNRRNHYRVLHVQPEAPPEIIKAAFRTLMGPLRHHPDLGGDHETAALMNEAYAVLSDPARRAAYDRTLNRARLRSGASEASGAVPPSRPASAPSGASRAAAGAAAARDSANWRLDRVCPFCRSPLPETLRAMTRCARCQAPLAPLPKPEKQRSEMLGARRAARVAKQHFVSMIPRPGVAPVIVRMRDLSFTGLSVVSQQPLQTGHAFRVIDGEIETVARVVACRRHGSAYTLHAELLTIRVDRQAGVFVSAHA